MLSDLWSLMMRFRGHRYALISDITKAYHSLKTGVLEMHIRRIVWRYGDANEKWRVFGLLVIAFGDRTAAALLEIVIKMTVQMYGSIDLIAARKIENGMFVDDVVTGGELEEVLRFKGTEDPESYKCDGTVPDILARGGLRLKAMQMSGEEDGPKLEKLGGAVLEIKWSSQEDMLYIDLSVNISRRKKGQLTGPALTVHDLNQLDDVQLTRRLCLSIANCIYDPCGLVSPMTIRMKVAMKMMFAQEYALTWDTQLPQELQKEWRQIIIDLVRVGEIPFPRSIRPRELKGRCSLVVFFDGSSKASRAVVYAIWMSLKRQRRCAW